jgi:hypothetical protein
MGMTMAAVKRLDSYGLFGAGKNIADFGSSNLYSATAAEVEHFVRKYNPNNPSVFDAVWAQQFAAGTSYNSTEGGLNSSFVGELFDAAGMTYHSIDIAKGYQTTVVDLNRESIPPDFVGLFDTVLNFGTSEHILNQLGTFRAIHDATKVGGAIVHQLPNVGYVDHGYFTYTSRFFFDLAGYNEYEIVDYWLDMGAGNEHIFSSARQYRSYFPKLNETLSRVGSQSLETELDSLNVPTVAVNVVFRKIREAPFMGVFEASTSVGDIPSEVRSAYQMASVNVGSIDGKTAGVIELANGLNFWDRLRLAIAVIRS